MGNAVCYSPIHRLWFNLGVSGSNTVPYYSADGVEWTALSSITNFGIASTLQEYDSTAPSSVVIGGGYSGGTVNKIKISTDAGATWGNIAIGSNDNAIVSSLSHATAGYFARVVNDIYFSATGASGSYSLVQAVANPARPNSIVTNGSLILAYSYTGSSYYTTSNGTAWTTRTFPNSFVAESITYGSLFGVTAFYAVGIDVTGLVIYNSTNGTSWTDGIRLDSHPVLSTATPGSIALANGFLLARFAVTGKPNIWYLRENGDFIAASNYPSSSLAQFVTARRLATSSEVHQVGIFAAAISKTTLVG
jgi:photosystem II stability/assembly factor-like uncharacterized protein